MTRVPPRSARAITHWPAPGVAPLDADGAAIPADQLVRVSAGTCGRRRRSHRPRPTTPCPGERGCRAPPRPAAPGRRRSSNASGRRARRLVNRVPSSHHAGAFVHERESGPRFPPRGRRARGRRRSRTEAGPGEDRRPSCRSPAARPRGPSRRAAPSLTVTIVRPHAARDEQRRHDLGVRLAIGSGLGALVLRSIRSLTPDTTLRPGQKRIRYVPGRRCPWEERRSPRWGRPGGPLCPSTAAARPRGPQPTCLESLVRAVVTCSHGRTASSARRLLKGFLLVARVDFRPRQQHDVPPFDPALLRNGSDALKKVFVEKCPRARTVDVLALDDAVCSFFIILVDDNLSVGTDTPTSLTLVHPMFCWNLSFASCCMWQAHAACRKIGGTDATPGGSCRSRPAGP